ncbi:MAG: nuclease [Arachnia propionica]|nr:MAG: nuclease [Arachnia propionica]
MTAFLLDGYAARSCPVKIQNLFSPATQLPEPLDESLHDSFQGGKDFTEEVFDQLAATGAVDCSWAISTSVAAIASGAAVIIRAMLPPDPSQHRQGKADVLVRGDNGYWPVRIKPYRVTESQRGADHLRSSHLTKIGELLPLPNHRYRMYREGVLLELAHQYRLLEALDAAAATPLAGVICREQQPEVTWVDLSERFIRTFSRTAAAGHRLRSALERYDHEHQFRVHVATQALQPAESAEPAVRPIRVKECEWCNWWQVCRTRMDDDDLSLRIAKTPLDVRELQTLAKLGIHTVEELAVADINALLPEYLPNTAHRDRAEQRLRRAAKRAHMIVEGIELQQITAEPIAVPRTELEIDLDIESDDGGHTYLWGLLLTDRATGQQTYRCFSRFCEMTGEAELELAESFAAWLLDFLAEHPNTAVFHYSDYEVVQLRRIATAGASPRLQRLLQLVPSNFVDLFRHVRDHFFGVDGLGLKQVATKGAGFSWRDEDPGGLNSQSWFNTATTAADEAERAAAQRRVLEYNEDDVRATWAVREWFDRLDAERAAAATTS